MDIEYNGKKINVQMEWVAAKDFYVDHEIQRPAAEVADLVSKIVDKWSPIFLGALTAVRQQGQDRFMVLDGQARWSAAMQIDPQMMLPTVVLSGLGLIDKYDVFNAMNGMRKGIDSNILLRNRIRAGYSPYVEAYGLMQDFVLDLSESSKGITK